MRSPAWYLARLSRMSPAELAYRTQQLARRKGRKIIVSSQRLRKKRFSYPSPAAQASRLLGELPRPRATRAIRFFEVELPYPGGQRIDWSRDYKNNINAPLLFYGDLDYRDARRVGDVKYTWELNRHQFLAPWAIEYATDGNDDAALAIVRVILEWIAANPVWTGINWTSSLESALRIVSWGIALDLCRPSRFVELARDVIELSVYEQTTFIRDMLSLYSSANNHLMGELVGLLAAGACFPDAPYALKVSEFARDRLLAEAARQNFSDGVNREQAIYYHHYTLEYLLTAMALFRRLSWEVPDSLTTLCHKMISFVDAMTDNRGEPFEIGDRDDGTVTGLNLGTDVGVFESLLWSGWILYGDATFRDHAARIARSRGAKPGVDRRTAYWHGAVPVMRPVAAPAPSDGISLFPEAGYAILRTQDYHLLFKAGPFGYPSIAAHSHCDQLSVLLKHGGTDVLTDAGTFCYHTEGRWRRYFKGTSAHNTVRVDELDQAEYAGPFLWSTHADASFRTEPDQEGLYVTGTHNGYARLRNPVSHQRTVDAVQHAPDGCFLAVRDVLKSNASHGYEIIWNFGPDVVLEAMELPKPKGGKRAGWYLRVNGHLQLAMVVESRELFQSVFFQGNETVPAGFASRRFGERVPVYQLRIVLRAQECEVMTRFGVWNASWVRA